MMTSFGLRRQRHGHGGGWPRNRRGGGKRTGEAVSGKKSGDVTPICTLTGEPECSSGGRCLGRSGETARCEPTERWLVVLIRSSSTFQRPRFAALASHTRLRTRSFRSGLHR